MSTIHNDPNYIFYEGSTFTVEWYFDERGRMKAQEYFERISTDEKDRLRQMIKFIADSPIGTRLQRTHYNLEDGREKIYAFKPKAHRFFNFMTVGRKIIILDAYRKHSQKMTRKDLNVLESAINAKKDYIKRVEEGRYYEGVS